MNETIKSIKKRYSCKSYLNKRVPLSKLKIILEASKQAPSALNRQICSVLCLNNPVMVNKLRELSLKESKVDYYYNAPVMVLVYGPKDDKFLDKDGACILENIFIAASSLNIDSCWINHTDDLLNSKNGKSLKKELAIPNDARIVGTAILGYRNPKFKVVYKKRKDNFIKII